MAERLIIQLLAETLVNDELGEQGEEVLVDTDSDEFVEPSHITRRFRWGFVDELSNWHAVSHEGSDQDMLQALEFQSKPATLLMPGARVVTLPVAYSKKEARHFLKLLPYQVEDDILGSVDDLFFAVGNRETEVVTAGYVDEQWLSELLSWFQQHDIIVERCIADYQCLHTEGDEQIIWFTDGYVWGHRVSGLGFSVAQALSQPFLSDLLVNQQDIENPWQVKVYVEDAEAKEIVETHILPPVDYEVVIGQPPLDFEQSCQLNFCRGRFGKKLPIDKWWQEAKSMVVLSAAAVVVFFIATFTDIYMLKQQRSANQQALLETYRTVVPRGPATDPIRRLKSMVGRGGGQITEENSQSVFLLSKVAPVLDQLKITLTTLNYSNKEQALRININANSFNGIEQFRQQLDSQGLQAELQSSGAAKEGFQGRLRISIKGGV